MSKGIDARFELEEISIAGYETLLMQVWTNLIDNAIKFTPTGGIIVLSLTRDDDGNGVIFSIRDSGVGIAPGQVDHIFDKFYQADNSRGTEGNGLGLAIVSRIVQIHGGTIRVESSPGEGSVFTVFLKNQPG
jgi:signal transduction histidine kinase